MAEIPRREFLLGLAGAAALAELQPLPAQPEKKKKPKFDPVTLDRQVDTTIKTIAKKGKFPIKNFGELTKALGGPNATITIGDQKMTVADLKKGIPNNVFPITSEEDLAVKASRLRERVPPGQYKRTATAKLPKGEKPPTVKAPGKPKRAGTTGIKKKAK